MRLIQELRRDACKLAQMFYTDFFLNRKKHSFLAENWEKKNSSLPKSFSKIGHAVIPPKNENFKLRLFFASKKKKTRKELRLCSK